MKTTADPTGVEFFEQKQSPNAHPLVLQAWKEVLDFDLVKKHPGGKHPNRMLWLSMVKDAFARLFIQYSVDKTLRAKYSGLKQEKFLCQMYENGAGKLTLILGYDVEFPDTYHLMIRLI